MTAFVYSLGTMVSSDAVLENGVREVQVSQLAQHPIFQPTTTAGACHLVQHNIISEPQVYQWHATLCTMHRRLAHARAVWSCCRAVQHVVLTWTTSAAS